MPQVEGRRIERVHSRSGCAAKNLLLILDNCEHVLEPVAAIANAICT